MEAESVPTDCLIAADYCADHGYDYAAEVLRQVNYTQMELNADELRKALPLVENCRVAWFKLLAALTIATPLVRPWIVSGNVWDRWGASFGLA